MNSSFQKPTPITHRAVRLFCALAASAPLLCDVVAQVVAPEFQSTFRVRQVAQMPDELGAGAIAFKPGSPNTLLVRINGGSGGANSIYQVNVSRDGAGRINGLAGAPSFYAAAPSANDSTGASDGSLVHAPNGTILYTSLNDSSIRQVKPGSTTLSKELISDDYGLWVGGGMALVPPGLPAAGHLKIVAFAWQDAMLVPDDEGTYDIQTTETAVETETEIYGIAFAKAGDPGFSKNSILAVNAESDQIVVFDANGNSDPIVLSKRPFITSLQGAIGLTVDPSTGDYLASDAFGKIFVIGRFNVAPPTVAIVAPANGAAFNPPGNVAITAQATQQDGAIAKVEFFLNGVLLSTDTTAPYEAFGDRLPPGAYTIQAIAFDSGGASATNSIVFNVINQLPTATLLAPATNQVFQACSTITIRATGTDVEDTVPAAIEFYNGTTLIGRDNAAPFEATIPHALPGAYSLKAVAIDSLGGRGESATIPITVLGPALNHAIGVWENGGFHICYHGEAGQQYIFEVVNQLPLTGSPAWTPFATNRAVAGSLLEAMDMEAAQHRHRFYRVRKAE